MKTMVRRVQRINTREDVAVTLTREDFLEAVRTVVPTLPDNLSINFALLDNDWSDDGRGMEVDTHQTGIVITWTKQSEEIKEEES